MVPKDPWYGFPGFYWHEPNSVPQCLISHLKKIGVHNVVGMPSEIHLLEYMFKFGEALEMVEIRCSTVIEKLGMKKLDERLEDLARREKASRSCAIVVLWPN